MVNATFFTVLLLVLVLLYQISPSKYNEFRFNKATMSRQHCNKEADNKRNKLCLVKDRDQGVFLPTTVSTMKLKY